MSMTIRMTGQKLRMLGTASAIAVAMLGMPALAQEQQREASDSDIIVTAQFREQRLQDTPIAITAVSGDMIENRALNSIADVAGSAPNVNITQTSSAYGGAAIYIRGVGQYDSNFALEPGVGVYVDDVYHGTQVGSLFDLLDLERVEILRGPQGTLAGKNSIGGAVKLYSRRPEGTGDGFIQATVGNFDRIELRGGFDLGLADNLFMRVSGFSKRRDGHVDLVDYACENPATAAGLVVQATSSDCRVGSLGGIRSWGMRGALRYLPTESIEINLIGQIIRDDSQAAGVEQVATADPRFIVPRDYVNYSTYTDATGWRISPVATTELQSVSGQVDIALTEDLQLTSITAYTDLFSQWSIDGDGGPLGTAQTLNRSPYHQFTQEVRLNGDFGDGFALWTVGGFYFDSLGHVGARVYSFPALNFIQDDPVSNESKSVFAHLNLHPTDALSITAGIRYTDDQKTYTFSRLNPATGLPAAIVGPLNGVSRTYAGNSTDYRLGVDYRLSEELMVYASLSTGYKGGGVNPRPFIPAQVVGFNSETVTAYEVGFKSDLFGRVLRLNAAAFLNNYEDIILIDANGFPGAPGDPGFFPLSAAPFNAGDADIKGFEVEAMLDPGNGLTLDAALSYLDFQYQTLDPNATASGIGPNFIAPFTPEWKWSITAAYEHEFANGATLRPQVFVESQTETFTDPVNSANNRLDGRTIANANITYSAPDDDWSLVLGVTNLTDKHYYTNAFEIVAVNGNNTQVVARPREWYLTVRKNF